MNKRCATMLTKEIKNYNSVLHALDEIIADYLSDGRKKTNEELLGFYWRIGTVLLREGEGGGGWRSSGVRMLEVDLKGLFPRQKCFNERNLRYMRSFARNPQPPKGGLFVKEKRMNLKSSEARITPKSPEGNLQFLDDDREQLDLIGNNRVWELCVRVSWYHHTILMDKVADMDERLFYMEQAINNRWGARTMGEQIARGVYKRQRSAINNFSETMPVREAEVASGMFRSPYVFDFMKGGVQNERELEEGLVAHLEHFMFTLGRGFAYVGNQFTLPVADTHYYLDLLFYNIHLHCYVVVELKVDDFLPEYIGKLNFYVSKVDESVRGKGDNPTMGILLCQVPNEMIVRYALRNILSPIGVAGYEV